MRKIMANERTHETIGTRNGVFSLEYRYTGIYSGSVNMERAPRVLTSLGNIKGKRVKTRDNRKVFSFKCIPYAKPPTGSLRFRRPVPPDPWPGTRDCSSKESPPCLQVNVLVPESKFLIGSEDCLYLNVFTPKLPGSGRNVSLPVIVFFHGGAFAVGSNDSTMYGPQFFLDHYVVLVTINYRLGPLGFLSFETDDAPGNLGMHDQVMALRWVNQHIDVFGGDPANVTIMGESAGGMSCFLHLVSPLSKGLFHRVIAMSASASTPFLQMDRRPSVYAHRFANHLGAPPDAPVHKVLNFLRGLPAKTIVEKAVLFKDWDVTNPLPWKPSIDPDVSDPFLPRSFEDVVRAGEQTKVPILVGCTSHEGLILTAPFFKSSVRWDLLFRHWEQWAPLLLLGRERDLITTDDVAAVNEIRVKFFGSTETIPARNEANLGLLEQIFSSAIFHAPLYKDLQLLSENGQIAYLFNLSYQGSMTLLDLFRLPVFKLILNFTGRHMGFKAFQKKFGVCHGDDLFYFFPFATSGFPKALKHEHDRTVSLRVVKLWCNMAKYGDPTPKHNADNDVDWEPFDLMRPERLLRIDSTLAMQDDRAVLRKVLFWNKVTSHLAVLRSEKHIPRLFEMTADKRNLMVDPAQLLS